MILLVLQFHESDKSKAMALARLLADLQPHQGLKDTGILFSCAHGTEPDKDTLEHARKAFSWVGIFRCQNAISGWPEGPNNQVYETLERMKKSAQHFGKYRAIFLVETDCVPVHRHYLRQLRGEFIGSKKQILGCWRTKSDGEVYEHINGSMLMAPSFFLNRHNWPKADKVGWDCQFFPDMRPAAAPSRLIWLDYKLGTDKNPWKGDDDLFSPKAFPGTGNPLYGQILAPVWHHGCKTDQALEVARNRLLRRERHAEIAQPVPVLPQIVAESPAKVAESEAKPEVTTEVAPEGPKQETVQSVPAKAEVAPAKADPFNGVPRALDGELVA